MLSLENVSTFLTVLFRKTSLCLIHMKMVSAPERLFFSVFSHSASKMVKLGDVLAGLGQATPSVAFNVRGFVLFVVKIVWDWVLWFGYRGRVRGRER